MTSKITVFSVIMLVCIIQIQCSRIKRDVEEPTTPEEEGAKPTEGGQNPLGGIKDKLSGGSLPDSKIINNIGKMMKEVGPKEFINIFRQFVKT